MTDALWWFVWLYAIAMTALWLHAMVTRQRKTARGRDGRFVRRVRLLDGLASFPGPQVKDLALPQPCQGIHVVVAAKPSKGT